MTHDELVKFAAEKVGVTVKNKTLFSHVEGDKDIYTHEWFEVDEQDEIEDYFDLTSPDLFFKGLAVLVKLGIDFVVEPKGIGVEYREFTGDYSSFDIHSAYKDVHSVNEIPQKFWECWAEVEGKGNLTKED